MSHHHSGELFDPDDPLTMMGVAMVGMALQEAAEEQERLRRARLTPWQRAEEDRRAREAARLIVGIVLAVALLFLCVLLSSAQAGP